MGLWQDLQFAVRLLVKDKWFTLVATIALALGIGVNATVFTFVNAVLIRGLPFDQPDQIMAIGSADPVRNRLDMGVSYLDFRDWAEGTKSFTGLALHTGATMNVSDEGRVAERFAGASVSANMFALLGQAPMLGRNFLPEDDRRGAPPVVLLGSSIFKNRYASDPAIIGRTIRINEVPSVVIGVMPEGFRFPFNADLWRPLGSIADLDQQKRNARGFQLLGRLAPGVSREQAQAELDAVAARLAAEFADTNKDIQARVQPYHERVNGGPIRAVFLSLMGAVVFVLLIACANVANLLLARAGARAREIAVRVSIGASRARIVRQLLVESLLVALVAGLLGLALSIVGIRLFDAATQDVGRPYWIQFTMDGSVFAFLAAVCLGTAVAFGLAPALHIARTDVNEVLKEGGRSGSAGNRVRRWTSALVIGELALTLALLAGAGFMMRNFMTMYRLDIGVETSRLLTMSLVLPDAKYPALEQRLAFYQQLQDRLGSRFEAVSVATNAPLQGGLTRRFEIVGQPATPEQELPSVTFLGIDPRYFHTMGVNLVRGRGFTETDGRAGQENAIINARLAQMYFSNEDPLGRQIVLSLDPSMGDPPPGIPMSQTVTVVGIAPNIRQRGGSQLDPDPIAYVPFTMQPRAVMTLVARSTGDPHLLTPAVREEMRAIDPDLPLFNIRTMDETLAQARWPFRVFGSMFAIFALIALVLSAVGLYAVTAYSVTQRTQEIGIRSALGAQSGQVMWLFVRRAFIHMGIGLTLGIAAALGVGSIFESADLLVQINGRDPITIGSIALLLAIVSLAASTWPARRATQLDPLVALRRD
jgi:putative ABC transport system permease protein